jgi:hypothetical protein
MKKLAALFFCLVIASGCVPSFHELYTEKDVVFDPALIGVWTADNEKESWDFSKDSDKSYKLVHTDNEKRHAEFSVHLVKLKESRFLDLYLTKATDAEFNGWAVASLVPAHLFLKVEQIGPVLRMAAMDPDWLKEFLAKNPKAIDHETLDDRIVLTASTADLQKFLLEHAQQKLFGDVADLKRKPVAK